MPGGRPTKYTKALVEKAWSYINGGWEDAEHAIPSAVGMADQLNVSESTLYRWAEQEGKEFREILERCKDKQQLTLVNGGLKNELNSNIVKLALGKHGFHEKVDNTHGNPGGGPVQVEYVGVPSDGRRSKD